MAAIPDTGSAQCARRGAVRVLSRALVLGGMVVAGWLLGSGIGLANEDPGQPGTDLVQMASHPGDGPAQSEGGSDGQLGVPPTLGSAITRACPTASAPQPSVPPPVQLGVPRPLANAVGIPKPLARVLNPRLLNARVLVPRVSVPRVSVPRVLVPRVLVPRSRPGKPGVGIRSQAPAGEPVTARLAEPAGRSAAVTAPLPTLGFPAVSTTVEDALPTAPLHAAPAERSAFGDDPAAPVPASPPANTSSCVISSTGSGAVTKNAPDITMHDGWATAEAALMFRLRQRAASDLPRSVATQPSTSPD